METQRGTTATHRRSNSLTKADDKTLQVWFAIPTVILRERERERDRERQRETERDRERDRDRERERHRERERQREKGKGGGGGQEGEEEHCLLHVNTVQHM